MCVLVMWVGCYVCVKGACGECGGGWPCWAAGWLAAWQEPNRRCCYYTALPTNCGDETSLQTEAYSRTQNHNRGSGFSLTSVTTDSLSHQQHSACSLPPPLSYTISAASGASLALSDITLTILDRCVQQS